MTQAFGTYIVLLQDTFGWSKTALAAASSLRDVENGVMGPVQGFMLDRFGAPNVTRLGLVVLAGGFFAFSQVQEIWHFYLADLAMAVGVSLAGYVSVTYTAVQWFERKRATAIALGTTGLAVGGMAVPITVFALENLGWRETAFASGVIILLVGLPLTLVIRRRPPTWAFGEPDGLPDDGRAGLGGSPRGIVASTYGPGLHGPREALRRARFTGSRWATRALFIVSALIVHLVSHLNRGLHYSLTRLRVRLP